MHDYLIFRRNTVESVQLFYHVFYSMIMLVAINCTFKIYRGYVTPRAANSNSNSNSKNSAILAELELELELEK